MERMLLQQPSQTRMKTGSSAHRVHPLDHPCYVNMEYLAMGGAYSRDGMFAVCPCLALGKEEPRQRSPLIG